MANRRHFLSLLTGFTGLTGAAAACSSGSSRPDASPASEDEIERALGELNRAAGLGISDEDFARARSYAAGAYREAASSLRPIELDASLDLPVAFAARRGGR